MTTPLLSALGRSALAGASTGGRTFTCLATLSSATSPDAVTQPDRTLGKPSVKALLGLAGVGEWVTDQLPQTPSRLDPPGLVGRIIIAAGCGVIISRRESDPGAMQSADSPAPSPVRDALCAGVAAATAFGFAWLGEHGRLWAAGRIGKDFVGAAVEDGIVLALATAAAR